ncbi:MAG: hypothetical protein WCG15_08925, partial [Actinomycetes bacterium]
SSQYVRGDGTLANFPTNQGGGSSVSYYLNGSVNQGTFGGNTYYEMNKTPITGAGTNFTINANGYIAQFLTDAGDPALLSIPGGNWNFELYFSASSGGGTPSFYVELYKYDGTTFTLINSGSTSPESITGGTAKDLYVTALAVPQTTLTVTDRLAVRVYVTHSGRTITLHTEDNNLCQVITTFSTGINALNGLTAQVQYFATGTSGSNFNISSTTDTHTFNIPSASATNRGLLTSADWTTFNSKVTSVTGTAPVVSSGGATPAISMAAANGSTNGYLTSTDWTTFNNKGSGTVTSVAATVPSFLSVAGSPITSSGTLAISLSGTALPVANGGTGITSFGTGIATFLGTPSSANLFSALTDDTGTGLVVFNNTPSLTAPVVTNYTETLFAPAASSSFTVNLANGTVQRLSLNANGTITLPSSVAGKSFVIIVTYSGAFTLTWAGGSTIKWPSGTVPTASSANGKFDIFTFFQDGTNTYGNSFGLNY